MNGSTTPETHPLFPVSDHKEDEFRMGLIKLVLKYGDETKKIGSWFMLLNAIENMEEVADHSEDVADVIRSIAILG